MNTTPGPWNVLQFADELFISPSAKYEKNICKIINTGGKSHHANANLIAFAPDLLEALEQCVKALEVVSSFGATTPIIERAKEALKKAKGL